MPSGGNRLGRLTGPSAVVCGKRFGPYIHPAANRQRSGSAYASFPTGYRAGAAILALSDGGMACRMEGLNILTLPIEGVGDVQAVLSGSNVLAVPAYGITGIRDMAATLSGSNSMTGSLAGFADLACQMLVNQLTEGDVKGAVIDTEIEPGLTLKDALRILLAVAAGKSQIVPGIGAGEATVTFRDINDLADRVVATMDGSERTSVTLNP